MTTIEAVKLLLSSIGIMCLFGLTWLFAVFIFTSQNAEVSFALQFVFAFFNVFQGFYIFLFFVVLSRDARKAWRGLFCKCLIKEKSPSTYKLQSSKSTNARANKPSSSYSTIETKSKNNDHASHHDNIELEEKLLAEQEMELCVKVPPNNKPNGNSNENEHVNGNTDGVKSPNDKDHFGEEVKGVRVHFHSITQHTHHVEKAEMDFYENLGDDDHSDNDDTVL